MNISNSSETAESGKIQPTPRLREESDQKKPAFFSRVTRKSLVGLGLTGVIAAAAQTDMSEVEKVKDGIVTDISDESVVGERISKNLREMFLSKKALQELSASERQEYEKQQLTRVLQLQSIMDNAVQEVFDLKLIFEKSKAEFGSEHETTKYNLIRIYRKSVTAAGTINDLAIIARRNPKDDPSTPFICDACQNALEKLISLPQGSKEDTSHLYAIGEKISEIRTFARNPVGAKEFDERRIALRSTLDFSDAKKIPSPDTDPDVSGAAVYFNHLRNLPKDLTRGTYQKIPGEMLSELRDQ